MSTIVKAGWLKDKNGDKFAPKTLASQVQTSDGMLLEDKIQNDLDIMKVEILEDINNNIISDSELSNESTNPVQNKVINAEFEALRLVFDEHTIDSDIHFTSDERTKLDNIEEGAQKNTITGVKGNAESSYRTGNVNITAANIGLGNVDNTSDMDKPVSTLQQEAIDKAIENLASTNYVDKGISNHNVNTESHNDIRILINGLTNRLNTLANSDDETLDQMKEVVDYIKNNAQLIGSITNTKVNVADIVNNLTTNVANKPLSAAQGVEIKKLIDTLQDAVDGKQEAINLTANRALISNASGKVAVSDVTSTELGYLDGVTDNIQEQLDEKVPTSRTVNGKALSSNITLSASDVGAAALDHPHSNYENQNAFGNIVHGDNIYETYSAASTTDAIVFKNGNGITIDVGNDTSGVSVDISVASGTVNTAGIVRLTDSTSSTSTTTAATPNSVKSAYDLANIANDAVAQKTQVQIITWEADD